MPRGVVKKAPFKACRKCKALFPSNMKRCPVCGSTDISDEWEGMLIILDPDKSVLARQLGIEKPGRYAIKVH